MTNNHIYHIIYFINRQYLTDTIKNTSIFRFTQYNKKALSTGLQTPNQAHLSCVHAAYILYHYWSVQAVFKGSLKITSAVFSYHEV